MDCMFFYIYSSARELVGVSCVAYFITFQMWAKAKDQMIPSEALLCLSQGK